MRNSRRWKIEKQIEAQIAAYASGPAEPGLGDALGPLAGPGVLIAAQRSEGAHEEDESVEDTQAQKSDQKTPLEAGPLGMLIPSAGDVSTVRITAYATVSQGSGAIIHSGSAAIRTISRATQESAVAVHLIDQYHSEIFYPNGQLNRAGLNQVISQFKHGNILELPLQLQAKIDQSYQGALDRLGAWSDPARVTVQQILSPSTILNAVRTAIAERKAAATAQANLANEEIDTGTKNRRVRTIVAFAAGTLVNNQLGS